MEYKILLQMKYYNCVRDKTKSYVFGLGVAFFMYFGVSMRALFTVLSTFNDNYCSLNTCLILNNEWYETVPRSWKVENQHPKHVRGTTRPKQRARSVERATDNFWMHYVWPLDQPKELARSSGSVERPSNFLCQILLEQSIFQYPLHFFINHH